MSDDYLSVEDQVDDPRRAKTEKRRNRWLLFSVLGVLVAVLLAGIGIATWYGKSAVDALDNINRDSNLMPTGETHANHRRRPAESVADRFRRIAAEAEQRSASSFAHAVINSQLK